MKYPRIRSMREDRDLTQQELATYLHVTQKSYSRYENGERSIPTEILIQIADYYNVSTDYLLGRTNCKEMNTKN